MDSNWIKEAWKFIEEKTNLNNYVIGVNFPHVSENKKYQLASAKWWTAGFWPGILWQNYIINKNENLRITAENCEEKMDYLLRDSELVDHDMGFMWTLTSLANYKITGEKESRIRALLAANLLLGRFNSKGNYIRVWNSYRGRDDSTGIVIIDCMMNLPLLYWAAEETGDPRFRHAAQKHAEMVLKNFIREDGSVQHMVVFDSETGEVIEKLGGQGFSANSSWSRGCAWAIYGLALSYKYTNNNEFLNAAKKTANYFIANMKYRKCPVWDFRIPEDSEKRYSYLDSSAGAIAACGLLLISKYVPNFEKKFYETAGKNMLKDLYYECGTMADKKEQGLLYHGTGNFPEQTNIDKPLIYGDYFFTEGIARLNGQNLLFW